MEAQEKALSLFVSPRGRYIIGQALDVAIQSLSQVSEPCRESSNIADMRLLRDELFPWAKEAREMIEQKGEKGGEDRAGSS